ncbi:chromate resistance protein [Mycobacterium sp. PS03-16]|uniref:Chromate resistance protein ChrB n=1 Tax=Mycobacterium sp. PS03-16 TaxID=2559611 RepID=UPI001073CACC|nr:Chromate resistance protein ChrB [Mycobacterium sp. PS03-16]TFV55319.1 chromate resistance protein [Mycobacterium sp. PS03-16]
MSQAPSASTVEWVLLNYRLPREPSTPRITIWRKLKKLGVAQIVDGVVALPADARTREQFDWLADEIAEHDGQAGVWVARCTTTDQEQLLRSQMTAARVTEYNELSAAVSATESLDARARRAALKRLRSQLRAITRRDFFPPPEREHVETALRSLAEALDNSDADAEAVL